MTDRVWFATVFIVGWFMFFCGMAIGRPIVEAVGALRAALAAERERSRVLAEALEQMHALVLHGVVLHARSRHVTERLNAAATALQQYKDGEKADG